MHGRPRRMWLHQIEEDIGAPVSAAAYDASHARSVSMVIAVLRRSCAVSEARRTVTQDCQAALRTRTCYGYCYGNGITGNGIGLVIVSGEFRFCDCAVITTFVI